METTAVRPQTHVQSLIEQETALRMEAREKGAPGDMPEIDREITMVQGALQGVEQRLAELAARLRPVLDEKTWAVLNHGDDNRVLADSTRDDLHPQSEYGVRLRNVQYEIAAVEHFLSYLGQGVRT